MSIYVTGRFQVSKTRGNALIYKILLTKWMNDLGGKPENDKLYYIHMIPAPESIYPQYIKQGIPIPPDSEVFTNIRDTEYVLNRNALFNSLLRQQNQKTFRLFKALKQELSFLTGRMFGNMINDDIYRNVSEQRSSGCNNDHILLLELLKTSLSRIFHILQEKEENMRKEESA